MTSFLLSSWAPFLLVTLIVAGVISYLAGDEPRG